MITRYRRRLRQQRRRPDDRRCSYSSRWNRRRSRGEIWGKSAAARVTIASSQLNTPVCCGARYFAVIALPDAYCSAKCRRPWPNFIAANRYRGNSSMLNKFTATV
ncbi:hypothetical protein CIPAW_06G037300 [Carya illinoinensis]|uniref:Uncharacterized protein n=1 Tax=Carya illinoinensis TaxID=32201 RepID=A0A8T1Q7G6_CARIL|nr:hypothetical protein CIPAW_06G037300 [Carya illinoinensis]